jgi:hypothetical protein
MSGAAIITRRMSKGGWPIRKAPGVCLQGLFSARICKCVGDGFEMRGSSPESIIGAGGRAELDNHSRFSHMMD